MLVLFTPNAAKFADCRERYFTCDVCRTVPDRPWLCVLPSRPGNARLVWDRIPIMFVFMALISAVIAERVSVKAGIWLFPVLEAGVHGSVLLWRTGELSGHGDLRLYAGVQVYSILVVLLALFFPADTRAAMTSGWWWDFMSSPKSWRRVTARSSPSGTSQRPHPETSRRSRSRILDSAHAPEERHCSTLIRRNPRKSVAKEVRMNTLYRFS